MSDDLDRLRRLRPDRLQPHDPMDPKVLMDEKERLMSAIEQSAASVHAATRMPSIYPRLAYRDVLRALDFLTRAFGLRERREARLEHPDGVLAWLEIGDGVVMIGQSGAAHHELYSPAELGRTTGMVMVSVHDIDAHHGRAVAAGARVVMPLEDMFWGDRRYEALDLDGHRWHFSERLADIERRRGKSAE
ncbi:MAG: VOC family protein [Deltaproteobacteria bacterium]|nr:VOC family protein [Deltaproteobacteria bacterium]